MPRPGHNAPIGVAASINPVQKVVRERILRRLLLVASFTRARRFAPETLGKADLVFIDRTNLTVGPTSEVVLDKFVYDPVGSSGKVVLQTTRGAFRFVTGTQDHSAYQLNTPYGSLGVRGTTFSLEVASKEKKRRIAGCDVTLKVESGEVEFTTPGGNKREVKQGETVCVQGENISLASAGGGPPAQGPPGGGGPGGGGCPPQQGTPTCMQ